MLAHHIQMSPPTHGIQDPSRRPCCVGSHYDIFLKVYPLNRAARSHPNPLQEAPRSTSLMASVAWPSSPTRLNAPASQGRPPPRSW
ncbi:hypothetical protein C8Q77DRAFT_237344 [Trametes polyzona]|nr:hypothetical protein C8Q77DRAFT_237344 [Trametes polyzona]